MLPSSFNLRQTLRRGTSAALITQSLGAFSLYFSQILFARWMGVSEYGVYEYVLTIATVLSFIAGLGLSTVALRFISQYSVQQDWARLRGVIWGTWGQTLLAGVAIGLVGMGVVLGLSQRAVIKVIPPLTPPLLMGMGLVPLLALAKLQLEMGRAIRRIGLAYAPSQVIAPLLGLMGAAGWWWQHHWLSSSIVIGITIWTLLWVLLGQWLWLQRSLPIEVHQTRPVFALGQWLGVALPLLFIDGSFLVLNQTDTLMIGGLLNPSAVGIYNVAFKTANWVHFILASVNAIAAPLFASLYAQGKRQELQQVVSVVARWMFYPSLGAAIGLVVFAEPVLGLFGQDFVRAKWALMVLIIGQLVNVGAGSVGYLLIMTGHQNQCAMVVGWTGLLNLILNAIGIPLLGIVGAATATAISMSLWNIWMNVLVVKYLGVNPSIVAALKQ
ncbi:MAG: flippase [Elainella sp. Prado103]|jgi:O-antigen/teichoic acid export membrane protein|nr:flippase [Elainella sp. Prado103]